jgi:O-methyltransferase
MRRPGPSPTRFPHRPAQPIVIVVLIDEVTVFDKLVSPLRVLVEQWNLNGRYITGHDACPALQCAQPCDDETVQFVQPYTMTSPERIRALCSAVRYIEQTRIEGAVVECGVWRGGSMMAAARTLIAYGGTARDLYLFDTFEGMTEPGPLDISLKGDSAETLLKQSSRTEEDMVWCYAPIERVAQSLALTKYSASHIHLVPGPVEQTLTVSDPGQIALLRLDTDWYASTKHELDVLFPKLSPGGVLIIDDYGHWQGARRAVDEYMHEHQIKMPLHEIDYTARIGVKPL